MSRSCCDDRSGLRLVSQIFHGEFDPGSGRTLAACLTHASRARKYPSGFEYSGERVSNTWVTCPEDRDNLGKPRLIPNVLFPHEWFKPVSYTHLRAHETD